jgi:hypothetical protein
MKIEFNLDQDETMPHIHLKIIPTLEDNQLPVTQNKMETHDLARYAKCAFCGCDRHVDMFAVTSYDPLMQHCLLCNNDNLSKMVERLQEEVDRLRAERSNING